MSGGTGSYQAYLSKTCLGSNTLCSIEPLTGNIPGLSQQNYPRIANDGSAIAIVWKQSVNGDAQLPILLTPDITNGFPASYDTVAVNNVTNADVKLKTVGSGWYGRTTPVVPSGTKRELTPPLPACARNSIQIHFQSFRIRRAKN